MNLDYLTKKYKRYCGNCNTRFSIEYDEDKSGKIAKILDGQHRLAGFDGTNGKYTNR